MIYKCLIFLCSNLIIEVKTWISILCKYFLDVKKVDVCFQRNIVMYFSLYCATLCFTFSLKNCIPEIIVRNDCLLQYVSEVCLTAKYCVMSCVFKYVLLHFIALLKCKYSVYVMFFLPNSERNSYAETLISSRK